MSRREQLMRRALASRFADSLLAAQVEGGGLEGESADPRQALARQILSSLQQIYLARQERQAEQERAARQMEIARMQMDAQEGARADEKQLRRDALALEREKTLAEDRRADEAMKLKRELEAPMQQAELMQSAHNSRTAIEGQMAQLRAQVEQSQIQDVPALLQKAAALQRQAKESGADASPDLRAVIETAVARARERVPATFPHIRADRSTFSSSPQARILEAINAAKQQLGDTVLELDESDTGWLPGTYKPTYRVRR